MFVGNSLGSSVFIGLKVVFISMNLNMRNVCVSVLVNFGLVCGSRKRLNVRLNMMMSFVI